MKSVRNPKMVDVDDRNDMEAMGHIEHQGEYGNHVLKTMEKNPNKRGKKNINKSYGKS